MLSWCLHGEPSDEALMEGNMSIRDVKSPRLLAIPHFNGSPGDRQDLQGGITAHGPQPVFEGGQKPPRTSLIYGSLP